MSEDNDQTGRFDRRKVLQMSALTTVGATGLSGLAAAAPDGVQIETGELEGFNIDTLHSDEDKTLKYYEGQNHDFVLEINTEDSWRNIQGKIKLKQIKNQDNITTSKRNSLKQELKENKTVETTAIDLEDIWSPGYEIWTGVSGDCPAIQFDKDYEWGLAVDTGLPTVPLVDNDTIERLAIDLLCEVIERAVDSLSDQPDSPQLESHQSEIEAHGVDPRKVIAGVMWERGCKFVVEPLIGVLWDGAATLVWYDCHEPSGYSDFTAVCHGTVNGFVTSPDGPYDGVPAVPGAHYGLEVEYWDL